MWTCAIAASVFTRRRRALNVTIGIGKKNMSGAGRNMRGEQERLAGFASLVLLL
jgi:hypothetical protein